MAKFSKIFCSIALAAMAATAAAQWPPVKGSLGPDPYCNTTEFGWVTVVVKEFGGPDPSGKNKFDWRQVDILNYQCETMGHSDLSISKLPLNQPYSVTSPLPWTLDIIPRANGKSEFNYAGLHFEDGWKYGGSSAKGWYTNGWYLPFKVPKV